MENSFCVETRGEFGPHRDSVLRLPLHQFPIEGTKISEAGPPPSNRSSRGKHRRKTRSLQGVGKGTLVRSSRRLGVGWKGFGSFFSLFLSFLYRVSKLGRDVCLSIPEKKLFFGSKDSFYRQRGWRWWIRFSKREGEFVINRCFSSLLFPFFWIVICQWGEVWQFSSFFRNVEYINRYIKR